MKLHLSGVKLPKLGSLKDRIYREYLTKENQLEVEKNKLLMMLVMSNPEFSDAGKAREWSEKVKKIWTDYIALQFGIEIPESTKKEVQMLELYQTYVKHLKPKIQKVGQTYKVSGLEELMQ